MYCTVQDIKDRISESVLVHLTDDNETGQVNETKVTEAIEEAEGEIDAYCQARYTLPFDPVPKVIRKICITLVIYALFTRRGLNPDNNADAIIIQDKKDAIRFLENLAKGLVTIGPADNGSGETPVSPPAQTVQINGPDRIFSRDKMRDY
jgi:phage gp36-like protein